ncbi:hypothetical protein ACNKHK_06080 [Shigella flexneri]
MGGARSTTTVDMSRTYLAMVNATCVSNRLQRSRYCSIQADRLGWLVIFTNSLIRIFIIRRRL